MSQALYRKYRSKTLDEVVGQDHITNILANAIKSDRVAHAYLLTGPRGVGKTSVARILAHAINELPYNDESSHLDIIEIDAASNNGVDDVRELREKAQLAPVSAKKKVYIIDEVHMLSKPAFNALLKTLEEPPAHVVFILATTDVDKLPSTIISRTQRFAFHSITVEDATKHLRYIADKENIQISDDALRVIAERGDGSFRDSIGLLDQISSIASDGSLVDEQLLHQALGLAPKSVITTLVDASQVGDFTKIVETLSQVQRDGISSTVLANQLIHFIRLEISSRPEFLELLDNLLTVSKSSHPDIKLLTTLGDFCLKHSDRDQSVKSPAPTKHKPSKNTPANKPQPRTIALTAPTPEVTATVKSLKKSATKKPSNFDWDLLLNRLKDEYLALYSVLQKCGYELDLNDLTLYTTNKFYKKKLDTPKYSSDLYKVIDELFSFEPIIHTVPTTPPIKDSQAASIVAIMGGGVEVSIDTE